MKVCLEICVLGLFGINVLSKTTDKVGLVSK